jgi:hypothetical protein
MQSVCNIHAYVRRLNYSTNSLHAEPFLGMQGPLDTQSLWTLLWLKQNTIISHYLPISNL